MIESSFSNEDLLKALKQFPQNIQKNVIKGAVRAGCKPIVQEAKKNVPKETGNLKKSIGVVARRSKDKSKIKFAVTPRRHKKLPKIPYKELKKKGKLGGYYAHMIEFGTSTIPAQPFMRPAFENQDNQSIEEVKKYMAKRIDKEILKAKNGRS